MYRKLHHKLTLTFTFITGCILIIMSLSYQYLSEKQLKENSYYTFSSEANDFISSLEQQTVLKNEWLAENKPSSKYLLSLYDNGVPLSYNETSLLPSQRKDIKKGLLHFEKGNLLEDTWQQESRSIRSISSYTGDSGTSYHACYFTIPKQKGVLTGILIFDKEILKHQLYTQRIRLFFLNLVGISVLFLFCFYYTKKLLLPIQKTQEKQTAFVAAASHELRTPLAVILSCLSAADSANGTQREAFLSTAKKESTRMSSLLTDMLTLAKADSQGFSIEPTSVELDTLLLDSCEAFESLAKEKNITLTAILPENIIPPCNCDRGRIRQVLSILLSNGITYGTLGGYLKVSLKYSSHGYEIRVMDNGFGIPDEAKEHIFDRFYRVDASRSKKEHFGLGLCIAREIIEAHHGTIQVMDNRGGGTVFCFHLN